MSSFRNWKPGPPSPAMVVALIALAVSLGGSAWAVTKIGTKQIKSGAVTTAKLKNGAVTGSKVAAGAIGTSRLEDGAVTGPKVAAGAIGEPELADDAVTAAKIAQTTIRAANMRNNSVPGRSIQNGAVTEEKIADSARGALAYAIVDRTGPALVEGSTRGFTEVTRQGTGIYCLTPTPEVAALSFDIDGNPIRPLLATVEWSRSSVAEQTLFVLPNGSSYGGCTPGQYEVNTRSPVTSPSNAVSFIAAIP